MKRRSARRNPTTGMAIDTNSALLGAAVGAGLVYMLTKKDNAPGAMAYLPAEAPADEPWMRGLGYKQSLNRREIQHAPSYTVEQRNAPVYAGDDFQIDAKVYNNSGAVVPYLITLTRRNGELDVLDVRLMSNGSWVAVSNQIPEMQQAFRAMQNTGQSDQPFAGKRIRFGQLRNVTLESDRLVEIQAPFLPQARIVPSMLSPVASKNLRWK